MNSPAILMKNASFDYDGQTIFANLNLTLRAGKLTALLGKSGVGKTSLLRAIAGLSDSQLTNTSSILTSDKLPTQNRIAYMAQQDLLLPWLSVIENIQLGDKLTRHQQTQADKNLVLELISQVGLEGAEHKRPQQLSIGMRQRVALARTLYERKPIILLDEPFASVDAITRDQLRKLACQLLKEKTVLLVTHDKEDALLMAHDIYVMQPFPNPIQGPLVMDGEPYRDESDPDVFIASKKISLWLNA